MDYFGDLFVLSLEIFQSQSQGPRGAHLGSGDGIIVQDLEVVERFLSLA